MCCISFREATDALAHAGKVPSTAAPRVSTDVAKDKEGNPYFNPIVLMHCFSMMCVVMMMGGQTLLLPKLLAEPGFGLIGATEKKTQEQVANAMGLINVPSAALALFSNTFLFLPLTKKFGDAPVVAFFGTITMSAFCCLGFVTSHIWMITAIMALNGLSMGVVFPVVGPLFTKYYKFAFTTQ
jgi:MFS family permease